MGIGYARDDARSGGSEGRELWEHAQEGHGAGRAAERAKESQRIRVLKLTSSL